MMGAIVYATRGSPRVRDRGGLCSWVTFHQRIGEENCVTHLSSPSAAPPPLWYISPSTASRLRQRSIIIRPRRRESHSFDLDLPLFWQYGRTPTFFFGFPSVSSCIFRLLYSTKPTLLPFTTSTLDPPYSNALLSNTFFVRHSKAASFAPQDPDCIMSPIRSGRPHHFHLASWHGRFARHHIDSFRRLGGFTCRITGNSVLWRRHAVAERRRSTFGVSSRGIIVGRCGRIGGSEAGVPRFGCVVSSIRLVIFPPSRPANPGSFAVAFRSAPS